MQAVHESILLRKRRTTKWYDLAPVDTEVNVIVTAIFIVSLARDAAHTLMGASNSEIEASGRNRRAKRMTEVMQPVDAK